MLQQLRRTMQNGGGMQEMMKAMMQGQGGDAGDMEEMQRSYLLPALAEANRCAQPGRRRRALALRAADALVDIHRAGRRRERRAQRGISAVPARGGAAAAVVRVRPVVVERGALVGEVLERVLPREAARRRVALRVVVRVVRGRRARVVREVRRRRAAPRARPERVQRVRVVQRVCVRLARDGH